MLRLVFSLAVAVWLGAVVCVSFVVTPAAHGELSAGEARRLLRPVFPRFYRLGTICGILALGALLLGSAGMARAELLRFAAPVAIALIATVVGGEVLLPRLTGLDRADQRFERLHLASTMLNTTTLGALVLALAAAVAR